MTIQTNDPEEAKYAFRKKFSLRIGEISELLQKIPLIDTGHDGAEIVLHESRERVVGQWEMSATPSLDFGHNGEWDVDISQIYDTGFVQDGKPVLSVKQWTRLDVKFDITGLMIVCKIHE